MPFDKRKAYIEFLSKKSVNIVTPYRSKMYELTEGCTVDLISLKKENSIFEEVSGFYAVFEYDDENEEFTCSVHMRIADDQIDEIGSCSMAENKQVFSGSVWIERD